MIEITPTLSIDENEIRLEYIRASGPGGQNVNKVSTSVQLRYNVLTSPSLPLEVRERFIRLFGSRMTDEGELIIEAKRYRTQEQNREDAVRRLVVLVQKALEKPKVRKKTSPSLSSSAARVDEKKHRGKIKRTRKFRSEDWE